LRSTTKAASVPNLPTDPSPNARQVTARHLAALPQTRTTRFAARAAGIALLFASLGVASCQALFAADRMSDQGSSGTTMPAGRR
jgi:hypothetical protein